MGDWGLGIGNWGLGPIPNPQSPIPNPQSPIPIKFALKIYLFINYDYYIFINNIFLKKMIDFNIYIIK